ncbi:aldehyde dehydrogenase family protein [Pseudonocardia sp. GCM10023141]|uniref:aldehyde dehydrogenase family protein n=1 Tax=Pseudonocardia sp. GCM10023141 TaxID=3252653 RepID=UPI003612F1E5
MNREEAQRLVPKATTFVGDGFVDGTGVTRAYRHPGDGTAFAEPALGGPAEVDAAVAAARAALPAWRALAPGVRRDLLFELARTIRANAGDLAALGTLEMGMPIRAAAAGAGQAAEWFAHHAGWADKIYGATAPVGAGVHDYIGYSPRGVVGAIIPWNGPVVALALKVAPALAAGNCVVLKPSELAPFAALHLAGLFVAAGLPPGVFGVVGGGPDAGSRLVAHPDVDMVTFTGGNAAGAAVAAVAAARGVPAVLELGGKSASLVFDDADPARVGKLAAVLGCIQNSGQGCFLPTRLLVQRGVYEPVLDAVLATVAKARIGDPFDPATSMGPVVDEAAAARIEGVIRGGGGRLVAGGSRTGAFVAPTVFADVDPASALAQEEVFGPVLAVTPFDDEDEAVALANGTRFGLAGYVWTRDLSRAHRVADRLDAGYVSVNGLAGLPPAAPFGGWKASGSGVEGGLAGLREYLRTKNVHVQL